MSTVVALRARRNASLEEQRVVLVRQVRAIHRRFDYLGAEPALLMQAMESQEYNELHRRITEIDAQLL